MLFFLSFFRDKVDYVVSLSAWRKKTPGMKLVKLESLILVIELVWSWSPDVPGMKLVKLESLSFALLRVSV